MAPLIRTCALLIVLAGIGLLVHQQLGGDTERGSVPEVSPVLAKVDIDVSKLPGPRREYTPQQVAQVVMDALQNNDEKDSGIATCFNFASPSNKKLTGPLEHFIPMVKTAAYLPMLNFKSAEYDEAKVDEDHAEQLVTVTTSTGDIAMYVFQMSKQKDGDFKDCWMTDGVIRVMPKGKPA